MEPDAEAGMGQVDGSRAALPPEGRPEQQDGALTEEMVAALVRDFYGRIDDDALLGPMFRAVVPDWEDHLRVVTDFWSAVLLGTARYGGCVIGAHGRLRLGPEHFDRWTALFRRSVAVTLPAAAADRALAIADALNGRLRQWQARQQQD
ncbi:group III truncated hemoglobin [Ferrovibrio sp.]|uniref:group III truncated hemoglobin n=1 Tax=Ferrovibrio sp. TaxID=1917215 RepID=UPI00311E9F94